MKAEYNEDAEEAAKIARSALPLAGQLKLPVNPINYAVLYQHVAGHNPKLSQELEDLRAKNVHVTEGDLNKLYQQHIENADMEVAEALRNSLTGIVDTTKGSIDKCSSQSQIYNDYLGEASQKLSDDTDRDELSQMILGLMAQTKEMQSTTADLKNQLSKANSELETLRTDFKRVRTESMIDPLTQANNRRSFDQNIREQCDESRDSGRALCLLMLDIDHFKAINDTHGHIAGDAVLKWVSRIVTDSIRGGDFLARYGGEEFAVLLPETEKLGAAKVAENIRTRICEQKLRLANTMLGTITMSIGVEQYAPGDTIEAFIGRADKALYNAKETGRNKVCVFSSELV